MFDIHEITAAPHLPEALKPQLPPTRPENLFAFLAQALANDSSVEVRLREGEIFIALSPA
ncbi:hypothetical protein [Hyphomicrobium sp.]|uniref:hypothetical protein n=1 Tax=Hyphomicrobium sp. TaxID=82 RepID=UPI000FC19A73|nr:hypothetical protein [Hyphomicrobium sp.]RUO98319.1 MAG: hypothetical protein EKK30_12660 [Hyphomicrobium sp.]